MEPILWANLFFRFYHPTLIDIVTEVMYWFAVCEVMPIYCGDGHAAKTGWPSG